MEKKGLPETKRFIKSKQMTKIDIFCFFCFFIFISIMVFDVVFLATTTVPKRVLKERMVEHNMAQYNPKTGD